MKSDKELILKCAKCGCDLEIHLATFCEICHSLYTVCAKCYDEYKKSYINIDEFLGVERENSKKPILKKKS